MLHRFSFSSYGNNSKGKFIHHCKINIYLGNLMLEPIHGHNLDNEELDTRL